jgi:hypothetical protein
MPDVPIAQETTYFTPPLALPLKKGGGKINRRAYETLAKKVGGNQGIVDV